MVKTGVYIYSFDTLCMWRKSRVKLRIFLWEKEQEKKPPVWDQIVNDKEGGIGVNILQHWS